MTNREDKYYNIRLHKSAVVLELNYMLFLENESYEHKQNLISCLDEIEKNKDIGVLVISNNHADFSLERYQVKWDSFIEGDHWESNILRAFRTFNELFIRVIGMKMVVISMNSKPLNPFLFNFSLAADLRSTSGDFYIDNNNHNMVNISKGGVMFLELALSSYNPFKVIFLLDKIKPKTLYKRQIIDRIYDEELEANVLEIAKHLSKYEYFEFEVIKSKVHSILPNLEFALQRENDFLLTSIRKKVNQGKI